MFRYARSLIWSDAEDTKKQDVKPGDQIVDIQKVKFNIANETHRAYLQLKLKEFAEKRDQLTDADQKIAAASGICVLLSLTLYSNFFALAGYGCVIYFATAKTNRSEKSQAFFNALDELYQLHNWCSSNIAKEPPTEAYELAQHLQQVQLAEHIAATLKPYMLDGLKVSKYTHLSNTATEAVYMTASAVKLTLYGKRFVTPNYEAMEAAKLSEVTRQAL